MNNNTMGPGRRYTNPTNPNPNPYGLPPHAGGHRPPPPPDGYRPPPPAGNPAWHPNPAMGAGGAVVSGAVKTGASVGKIMGIVGGILAVVAVSVVIVVNVLAPEPSPFDPIAKLETAYNHLDYNALAETIDPNAAKILKGMVSTITGAVGVKIDSNLIEGLMPFIGDFLGEYARDYWDEKGVKMQITITEISTEMVGDSKANVLCRVDVQSPNGNETKEQTFKTVKRDGEWYLALF